MFFFLSVISLWIFQFLNNSCIYCVDEKKKEERTVVQLFY